MRKIKAPAARRPAPRSSGFWRRKEKVKGTLGELEFSTLPKIIY
jgi:hypothetical protein